MFTPVVTAPITSLVALATLISANPAAAPTPGTGVPPTAPSGSAAPPDAPLRARKIFELADTFLRAVTTDDAGIVIVTSGAGNQTGLVKFDPTGTPLGFDAPVSGSFLNAPIDIGNDLYLAMTTSTDTCVLHHVDPAKPAFGPEIPLTNEHCSGWAIGSGARPTVLTTIGSGDAGRLRVVEVDATTGAAVRTIDLSPSQPADGCQFIDLGVIGDVTFVGCNQAEGKTSRLIRVAADGAQTVIEATKSFYVNGGRVQTNDAVYDPVTLQTSPRPPYVPAPVRAAGKQWSIHVDHTTVTVDELSDDGTVKRSVAVEAAASGEVFMASLHDVGGSVVLLTVATDVRGFQISGA